MDSLNSSERPLCPGLETGHFVYVFRVLWRPSGDYFRVAVAIIRSQTFNSI